MSPHEFITRFRNLCEQYGHDPEKVWANCEMDEHQSLIDENEGEWQDFEQCLRLWQRPGMDWMKANDVPLPVIHCRSCNHYLDDFCGLYQREMPTTFNQANACKRWNE